MINHLFLMNKIDCLIDEIYQQTNSMFKNVLISIILSNFRCCSDSIVFPY